MKQEQPSITWWQNVQGRPKWAERNKGIFPTCFLPLPAPAGLFGWEHLCQVSCYEVWNTFTILKASGTTTGPCFKEGSPEIPEFIPELVLDSVLEPLLHIRSVIQLQPLNNTSSSLVNLQKERFSLKVNFFLQSDSERKVPYWLIWYQKHHPAATPIPK